MNELVRLYAETRQLTERMLAAAEVEQWQTLLELEAQRAAMLGQLAVTPDASLDDAGREEIAAHIGAILETDKRISKLSAAWMREMESIISSAHNERRLSNAYR
ncbi:flagellar protein FliT [Chitinivorax sp. PXF-14]|uniref:flagellar protein FliT n=1 Tax=Chitinivorax sp. PXF-14 TaxID=3230488 RepID=UPI0034677B77